MNNGYKGETTVNLYDIDYPMKFDWDVIASFESMTGKDFCNTALKAINAHEETKDVEPLMRRFELLTDKISRADAATLFYLAAHKANKVVTFEEIQEAVMMEGMMPRSGEGDLIYRSYPILFVEVVSFATMGILTQQKKKKQDE
jgi:hypothetical protein